MRKFLCLNMALLLVAITSWAQRTVTGRVTDANGAPVASASVQVKNTTVGTVTRNDGSFSLSVPENGRVLVISAVGMATQEIALGNQTTVGVSLQTSSDQSMQEVVVSTGYTRERKNTFAGAATVLSSRVVETVPVGSFDQALQGRAPGMLVNSASGQPGSSASITIRGIQSISGAGAQPLFVIDGVPMPSFDMQTINPNDFESITILKDANAAALYGARAGTGVIVITTKRGRAGTTSFQFRSQMGVTLPPDFSRLNLMNTAEMLQYEERIGLQGAPTNTPGWVYSLKNPANAALPANSPAGNPFAPSQARYNSILDSIRGIDNDWSDILYRNGISQSHEINMSGGTDRTRFYASGGYFEQQGIDIGSSLRRYTTRFNLEHTSNKLTVSLNMLAGFSRTSLSEGEWLGNSPRNPFQMTYRAKSYENPYKPDGSLNFGPSTTLNLKQVANLLEGIENSRWRDNQIKANGGLTLSYALLRNLTIRNTTGIDVSNSYLTRYVRANSYIGSLQTYNSGMDIEANRIFSQWINTTGVLFNDKFGARHEVEAGAYFEVVRGNQRAYGFTLFNLDPRLFETGQGTGALPTNGAATMPQNANSAKSAFGIRSYFGTARYTFDGKYSVNANIRQDATSRIANEQNREITTWSAGAMWNAMRENFMQGQKFLTNLRVRASYGIVPNIGSIATGVYGIAGIVNVTNYQGPQIPSFGATSYAGSTIVGQAPTGPGNPNLKIEFIRKANLGLDFSVWNDRARFTVDAYRNLTVDLFVSQPLGATTGFGGGTLSINAGKMSNKGLEFTMNVDVVRGRDFFVTVNANHAINVNKIEDLGLVNEYPVGTFIIRKGLPYGSHYTYHYLGADPANGRPRYETANGGVTNSLNQAGLFAKFGTYLPKHVGGFGTDVRWKRFTASALFSYQFDVSRYDNQNNWINRGTAGYHASVRASRELLTQQWQKPGDEVLYQAPIYDRDFTSADVKNAKFLRFRNLQVAYQTPRVSIGGTTIIKSARIYVQGQNLVMWSPWQGTDPEDSNNISLNEYPNPKMFVAGVDINF